MPRLVTWGLALGLALIATASLAQAAGPRVVSAAGHFVIDGGDGRLLRGADLKGAVIETRDAGGAVVRVRIDRVEAGPSPDIDLYEMSLQDAAAPGRWAPYCSKGQDGRARGFPLPLMSGQASPTEYTLVCTAGAQGKCIMRGYRPWAAATEGVSLAPLFEACVRMMRADYCGDGTSFTRAGIRIVSWDRRGVQNRPPAPLPLEAAWSSAGAVCISRVRAPDIATLERVFEQCPRLRAHVAVDCEASLRPQLGAVLWSAAAAR